MQLIRRLSLPALCALAVLVCALASRPYTNVGVWDDGPYIVMVRTLANTGHIVYNGWGASMMLFQLYLGDAFIKLFGFSFTTVRMSTLLVSLVTAFLLQRTLVRAHISQRNSTLGALAFVLSPLYLILSVTFMSDITGLFAIILCLYGCLRALQAPADRSAIGWLCFAVTINAVCGTSRQIAWLGTLVMVPCVLWLLRDRRRVLFAGATAVIVGVLFIFACMQWLKRQPYVVPVPPFTSNFPFVHAAGQLIRFLLDLPLLLLPIFVLFIPEIRKARLRVIAISTTLLLGFLVLALYPSSASGVFRRLLEPTGGGAGSWISIHEFEAVLSGAPLFIHTQGQVLLTIIAYGSLVGLLISFLHTPSTSRRLVSSTDISWKQLGMLLMPFTLGYVALLLSAAGTTYYIYDRYAVGLLVAPLICLVRYYQERIQQQLPLWSLVPIALVAIYGIALTHNFFAFDRARSTLAAELTKQGIPATSVDHGWDYNFDIELEHADHINNPLTKIPVNSYTPVPPVPPGRCKLFWYDRTPHIHPLYGLSLDPNACDGLAPFAPVHYSRWLSSTPGTIYVVRYTPG